MCSFFFFFFQAEDGIRDLTVTGVQTCALPISRAAPPRAAALLEDLAAACGGERRAAVARELTKVFEETRAGTLEELAGYYAATPPRGEVTVLVAGAGKRVREEEPPPDPEARARELLAQGMTRRDVADQLAAETGMTRNTAYRLVNEL